jgi:predicted nucleotidyltransferase
MTLMHPAIPRFQPAIAALCRTLAVRQLDIFGSAATQNSQEVNDFDFLVELESSAEKSQARRMVDLATGLEELLHAPVDVINVDSVLHPCFEQQVQA